MTFVTLLDTIVNMQWPYYARHCHGCGSGTTISKDKELFNFLRERKEEIEKEIGEPIEWVDAAVASRIKIQKEVSGIFNQAEAEKYFAWLYEKTILFQKVFGKYLKEFKG